jgi:hypothetical protein
VKKEESLHIQYCLCCLWVCLLDTSYTASRHTLGSAQTTACRLSAQISSISWRCYPFQQSTPQTRHGTSAPPPTAPLSQFPRESSVLRPSHITDSGHLRHPQPTQPTPPTLARSPEPPSPPLSLPAPPRPPTTRIHKLTDNNSHRCPQACPHARLHTRRPHPRRPRHRLPRCLHPAPPTRRIRPYPLLARESPRPPPRSGRAEWSSKISRFQLGIC